MHFLRSGRKAVALPGKNDLQNDYKIIIFIEVRLNRITILSQASFDLRVSDIAGHNPFWSEASSKPDGWFDAWIAIAGHQFVSVVRNLLTHHLNCKVLWLPIGHNDVFIVDEC